MKSVKYDIRYEPWDGVARKCRYWVEVDVWNQISRQTEIRIRRSMRGRLDFVINEYLYEVR